MKKIYIVALVMSLITGFVFYNYLKDLEKNSEMVLEEYVAAKVDITDTTKITEDMVEIKKVPKGYAHPLSASKPEDVVGMITENNILKGEAILPQKLTKSNSAEGGLSFVIPEGMRAVALPVDKVSGVAGNIRLGDKVDLIATVPMADEADPEKSQMISFVLSSDISVLSIGQKGSIVDGEESVTYETITLCLSYSDAVKVAQTLAGGIIRVALRNPLDNDVIGSSIIKDSSLIN